MIGSIQTILVEAPTVRDVNELQGRTENNRVVNFAGPVELIGQMVQVRITQSFNFSLRGELITEDLLTGSVAASVSASLPDSSFDPLANTLQ